MKLEISTFKDKYKNKSKDKILEEMFNLLEEKEKLECELKKYKNSNTPSSENKHLKKNTEGLKKMKCAKRGAPKGHEGKTLVLPEADIILKVFAKACPECDSDNIRPTGHVKNKKIICHQKAKTYVKEYQQVEYICLDEGVLF